MGKIVLGLGSSHTPMLLASDETLPRFEETDQKIRHRDKDGRPATYAELLEKADPKMAAMVAPDELVARQNRARAATAHLGETLAAAGLDALIVMSDDQDEAYLEDNRPTFAIYYGETILNSNEQHEQYHRRFPEWYVKNRQGFFEDDTPRAYPVDAKLALHLIDYLMDNGFDPASSKRMREGEGEGHGMAYVHRRLMDPQKPIPIVPVFLNTYFPPNQPRPRRCYALGRAIRQAVETYPGNVRVGIIASGGLSHFLVDEEFDRAILTACADKDAAFLQNLPRNKLHSGSSEILNWVGVAGACEHLDLNWFEYVPGYRTPAGTGTGLSFASWD
ncbi:MAG TPA: extradiol ring-cleavage dioxygenase [Xanthobacteraceae bacterium]|nr:extradiol ring-cleavage dioxygenase [Xanthobacteraceae bacterium]